MLLWHVLVVAPENSGGADCCKWGTRLHSAILEEKGFLWGKCWEDCSPTAALGPHFIDVASECRATARFRVGVSLAQMSTPGIVACNP